jgi:AcrR family transcriptional regulator
MAHSKQSIIDAAYRVAHLKHHSEITLGDVADEAGCTRSLIGKKGLSIVTLRTEVVRMARRRGEWRILEAVPLTRQPINAGSILAAAIRVAERKKGPWQRLSKREVAEEAGCSNQTVYNYFGSMEELCKAVAKGMAA